MDSIHNATDNFILKLITPVQEIKAEASFVRLPGVAGELGILAAHSPLLTELEAGEIHFMQPDGSFVFYFMEAGYAQVLPESVTILTEGVQLATELDLKTLEATQKTTKAKMENMNPEHRDYSELLRQLTRVTLQLDTFKNYKVKYDLFHKPGA